VPNIVESQKAGVIVLVCITMGATREVIKAVKETLTFVVTRARTTKVIYHQILQKFMIKVDSSIDKSFTSMAELSLKCIQALP
jgi:hypothetical protein